MKKKPHLTKKDTEMFYRYLKKLRFILNTVQVGAYIRQVLEII